MGWPDGPEWYGSPSFGDGVNLALPSSSDQPPERSMKLSIPSFPDGGPIPGRFAFCVMAPAEAGHVALAPNRNPHLVWDEVPEGTRSLALILHDPDVPSVGDDVNREGRSVPADLPRVDFFHWVLADILPHVREIPEGEDSDGVTPRGKPTGASPLGLRGRNDYTAWFSGDAEMGGVYGGYDGPCPPWNDERLHHYHFTLYALDVPTLGLTGDFGGGEVRNAMTGHILAESSWVGTYTLNPRL